jgi:hypothetical protein
MIRISCLLLLALLSTGCATLNGKTANVYAEEFSVDKTKNCGEVQFKGDPIEIKKCIFEKLTNLENFYTWYWVNSEKNFPVTGILMKDAILYITWYDKVGQGKEAYFQTHLCDKWDFDPNATKPVICFMKKPKTKIHLFELANLVELKII